MSDTLLNADPLRAPDDGSIASAGDDGRRTAQPDAERALGRILDGARKLTSARYAVLGVLTEQRIGLQWFLTDGIDADTRRRIGHPPTGRGLFGALIAEPRPLRVDDIGQHPQSYGFPAGHPPMTGFLGVPIMIHDEAWGYICLTGKQHGEFTETDQASLMTMAASAATVVSNARGRDLPLSSKAQGL